MEVKEEGQIEKRQIEEEEEKGFRKRRVREARESQNDAILECNACF